jgi:two-component system response regulator VicR
MDRLESALIIEDNIEIVESVAFALRVRWPDAKIKSTESGMDGLEIIKNDKPDIIILDLGLSDINGFEVLRRIRLFSDVPVLILTVRADESDIVKGLELGANDYVIKPFKQMELLSRVHVQLRKLSVGGLCDSQIRSGKLTLHPSSRIVELEGRNIPLTPTENIILAALMSNPGQVLTHGALAHTVWGVDYSDSAKSLKVHVSRLRSKLETDTDNPQLILTKPNIGYYLAK